MKIIQDQEGTNTSSDIHIHLETYFYLLCAWYCTKNSTMCACVQCVKCMHVCNVCMYVVCAVYTCVLCVCFSTKILMCVQVKLCECVWEVRSTEMNVSIIYWKGVTRSNANINSMSFMSYWTPLAFHIVLPNLMELYRKHFSFYFICNNWLTNLKYYALVCVQMQIWIYVNLNLQRLGRICNVRVTKCS